MENCWGPKTTVKDLGPDVLNLTPDPDNTDPWEDEDGPSFPELDDELEAAEAVEDFLIPRCYSLLVTHRSWQESYIGNGMLKGTSWGLPITIQHWILAFTRSGFLTGELRSWLRMSSLRPFMPSVTPTGISMSCWTLSWITVRINPWL